MSCPSPCPYRRLHRRASRTTSIYLLLVCLASAACSPKEPEPAAPPAPILPAGADKKCVVLLHGKGGGALPSTVAGDIEYLHPAGNAAGWGGREWRYFPDDRYEQLRASLERTLDAAGCGRAVVQGFSNGGAAAGKLYCRGEDFRGRVIGYLLDDPVPDGGAVSCHARNGVQVKLYWTGSIAFAADGWDCSERDWTCEGGRTIGIERYARELGTAPAPSIHATHAEYENPPEIAAWLSNGPAAPAR